MLRSSYAMECRVINPANDAPRTFTAGPVTKSPAQPIVSDHHNLPLQPACCGGCSASCSAAQRSLRPRAFIRCITRRPGIAPASSPLPNVAPTPNRARHRRPAIACYSEAETPYAPQKRAHMSCAWQARPVHHLPCCCRLGCGVASDSRHQHSPAREGVCPGVVADAVAMSGLNSGGRPSTSCDLAWCVTM